jgi:hypothetical protein
MLQLSTQIGGGLLLFLTIRMRFLFSLYLLSLVRNLSGIRFAAKCIVTVGMMGFKIRSFPF